MKFQEFQEDGMKKKANYSEFKDTIHDENNEFEEGRRSSDLGIGVKNQIQEEIEIPSHNVIETANHIKLKDELKKSEEVLPEHQYISN